MKLDFSPFSQVTQSSHYSLKSHSKLVLALGVDYVDYYIMIIVEEKRLRTTLNVEEEVDFIMLTSTEHVDEIN
jgi:hypothetical protein